MTRWLLTKDDRLNVTFLTRNGFNTRCEVGLCLFCVYCKDLTEALVGLLYYYTTSQILK